MGKRREHRVIASLPVVVTGTDQNGNPFTQTAQTIDVSRTGARLSGIRCLRGPGEMVTVECGSRSARFLVSWIGIPGSAEDGQFGVKALQPEKRIFRVELGEPRSDGYIPPPAHTPEPSTTSPVLRKSEPWDQSERRGFPRIRCSGTAQITQPGVAFPIWARIADLSLGGCYLELIFTMPRLSPVELIVTLNERRFAAKGTVVTSHPGIGVGVRFTDIGNESRSVVTELLRELTAERRPGQRPGYRANP